MRRLCGNPWKGNVRELQNVIEHVAVLAEPGKAIGEDDLPLRGESGAIEPTGTKTLFAGGLFAGGKEESYHPARDRVIAQFETQYLEWLIVRGGGNMSEAARIAGVDRTTLYRLMERHGVRRLPSAGLVSDRAVLNGLTEPNRASA